MPSTFGFLLLQCPLKGFIYLKRKFFYFILGRPTQDGDDESNVGFMSAAGSDSESHTLDEPHFPFRPTPLPLTSPLGGHLRPPLTQSRKRKALLIGVDHERTTQDVRPLKGGPHKDIRDMRQFLIGGSKFNSIIFRIQHSFADRWHYHPDDIIVLTDDPELEKTLGALQPTRNNIVLFGFIFRRFEL